MKKKSRQGINIRLEWFLLLFYSSILLLAPTTVELRSKGFYGTGLIFPIHCNSFIANVEMNRKIADGSLEAKFHCSINLSVGIEQCKFPCCQENISYFVRKKISFFLCFIIFAFLSLLSFMIFPLVTLFSSQGQFKSIFEHAPKEACRSHKCG